MYNTSGTEEQVLKKKKSFFPYSSLSAQAAPGLAATLFLASVLFCSLPQTLSNSHGPVCPPLLDFRA